MRIRSKRDIIQSLNAYLTNEAYPFTTEHDGYHFFIKDKEHTVPIPIPQYILLTMDYNFASDERQVIDFIINGVEKFKKDIGIKEQWVGYINIMEPIHSMTHAHLEVRIIGQAVPIDKDIHNVNFNKKVMDIINE